MPRGLGDLGLPITLQMALAKKPVWRRGRNRRDQAHAAVSGPAIGKRRCLPGCRVKRFAPGGFWLWRVT